jgi:hypothetical protein
VGLPPTMAAGRLRFREPMCLRISLPHHDSLTSTIRFALNQGTKLEIQAQEAR